MSNCVAYDSTKLTFLGWLHRDRNCKYYYLENGQIVIKQKYTRMLHGSVKTLRYKYIFLLSTGWTKMLQVSLPLSLYLITRQVKLNRPGKEEKLSPPPPFLCMCMGGGAHAWALFLPPLSLSHIRAQSVFVGRKWITNEEIWWGFAMSVELDSELFYLLESNFLIIHRWSFIAINKYKENTISKWRDVSKIVQYRFTIANFLYTCHSHSWYTLFVSRIFNYLEINKFCSLDEGRFFSLTREKFSRNQV